MSVKAAAVLLVACCTLASCVHPVNEAELEWRVAMEDAIEELSASVNEKWEAIRRSLLSTSIYLSGIERNTIWLEHYLCVFVALFVVHPGTATDWGLLEAKDCPDADGRY